MTTFNRSRRVNSICTQAKTAGKGKEKKQQRKQVLRD